MSRTEKLSKLANAVREYRGGKNADTGAWRHGRLPNPGAKVRVERWLRDLGVHDIGAAMLRIDAFKTADEFRSWLRTLGCRD